MSSDSNGTSWAERELLKRLAEGAWADFSRERQDKRRVRAPILRRLFVDSSAGGFDGTGRLIQSGGMRIRGAHIEGALDLTDCTGPEGTPLPALVLEGCDIPDTIDLSHARLARVSVADSRITHIRARGARIEGTFDFSRVSSYESSTNNDKEGIAWIDADDARIEGSVDGRGAQLRAPTARPASDIPSGGRHYALQLSNCHISGRINLIDGFRAIGGVTFVDSEILGEVWLRGAVSAGEGDAFRAQSTRFRSLLALDEGFTAQGQVTLLSAKVAGDLQCTDATFNYRAVERSEIALSVELTEIGGRVNLHNTKIFGNCSLNNTKIGGDLILTGAVSIGEFGISGAHVRGNFDASMASFFSNAFAITASNLHVEGDLSLEEAIVIGDLYFPRLNVRGEMVWTGLTFPQEHTYAEETHRASPEWTLLGFMNARIGAALRTERLKSEVWLDIDLGDARVAALDDKLPAGWGGGAGEGPSVALNLDGFVYDRLGVFRVGDAPKEDEKNSVRTSGLAKRCILWLSSRARIHATLMYLQGVVVRRHERKKGAVLQSNNPSATMPGPPASSPRRTLTNGLQQRILSPLGRDLRRLAENWRRVVPLFLAMLSITIIGIVSFIEDLAWGSWAGTFLVLGFLGWWMDRPRRYSIKPRLNWLEQQRGGFFPQPYRHLARVLRAQGQDGEARAVGIAEARRRPGGLWHNLLKAPFYWGFGFGLSPGRASITLALFILVGWYGTDRALRGGAMVVTTVPVAMVVPEPAKPRVVTQKGDTALATIEVPCTDQIIPLFYSIDLMLPVIPLHQESKCEVSTRAEFLGWQIAKFSFSILGKIVTALALITFSGVIKARSED
jgi:hypothetical protein